MFHEKAPLLETEAEEPIQDKILAVATALFIRHGFNGISFLGIAKELGISHSHIHYYFRTKALLAEAALEAYVRQARTDFHAIWTADTIGLAAKFIQSRDWIYRRYLAFNPTGNGAQNWGLLARFAGEAESMSPTIRKMLRTTLDEMDSYIAKGIDLAVAKGELSDRTPRQALVLQISTLLHTSLNLTRFEGNFQRLDKLLLWTLEVIHHAYGTRPFEARWPPAGKSRAAPRRRGQARVQKLAQI